MNCQGKTSAELTSPKKRNDTHFLMLHHRVTVSTTEITAEKKNASVYIDRARSNAQRNWIMGLRLPCWQVPWVMGLIASIQPLQVSG
mmetsp:Transcript_35937/g.53572  ORF Transcript_35937/g.53572 Transcript_35937/m.53572 type:complete len:87 (-) Transcript_35937:97-357(-)